MSKYEKTLLMEKNCAFSQTRNQLYKTKSDYFHLSKILNIQNTVWDGWPCKEKGVLYLIICLSVFKLNSSRAKKNFHKDWVIKMILAQKMLLIKIHNIYPIIMKFDQVSK